jgi:hypothetical protein
LPAFQQERSAPLEDAGLTQRDLGMAERVGVDLRVYRRQHGNQEQRGCQACRYELPMFGRHDGTFRIFAPGETLRDYG